MTDVLIVFWILVLSLVFFAMPVALAWVIIGTSP
jgi:hypothetical protein